MEPFEVAVEKKTACCFTGHRDIPREKSDYLIKRVMDGVKYLHTRGIRTFLAGGAVGFDTLATKAVIECRKEFADIRLVLVIPCRDQTRNWMQCDIDLYEQIMELADEVICLSEHYYRGCMHNRNRYLIDNSSVCICYLSRPNGGTAYTVGYARRMGLTIYNLAQEKDHK